ncbi:unnamed protein product [Clonostachys solani]|uniref:LysM domain-containing protein n=1 Tax=Clonostachys solani TaxID=160281 RepID=A0A9N9YXM8_9HYPO|nr:unnamed protein product [Clonostachys solani]
MAIAAHLAQLTLLVVFIVVVAQPNHVSATSVSNEQIAGFQAISQRLLNLAKLDSNCLRAAKQIIKCHETVNELGRREYHGSLGDNWLTDLVCAPSCKQSLDTARENIKMACAGSPNLLPSITVVSVVDSIQTGWKKPVSKMNSQATIATVNITDALEEYKNIEDMPEKELCSFCYGAKLRQMQKSEHSAYDREFTSMLEFVNKKCRIDSPIAQKQECPPDKSSWPRTCFSGKTITTKESDTCDSIALANSISSSTLYYINPHLLDCRSIESGMELCLPQTCTTYTIQEHEAADCVDISMAGGEGGWLDLIDWNLMLDSRCTNLRSTDPFWGHVICMSPPGDRFIDEMRSGFSEHPGNGYMGGPGGFGTGYELHSRAKPLTDIAKGTTRSCAQYIVAVKGLSCAEMVVSADRATPMDLFLRVNPSLGNASQCDENLKPGLSYCLKIHPLWDGLAEMEDDWEELSGSDMAKFGFFQYLRLKCAVVLFRAVAWLAQRSVFGYTPTEPVERKLRKIPGSSAGSYINVWVYTPPDINLARRPAVLINWHGSGFVLPGFGLDHLWCARVAQECGIYVVDADYRKGPEDPFPAAVEDAEAVLRWVAASDLFDEKRIAVSGFSSGANLALVAASILRKKLTMVDIKIPVAFYPVTNKAADPEQKVAPQSNKPVPAGISRIFNDCYVPDVAVRSDPRVSPEFADPDSFPDRVTILTAGGDNLAPEGNALAAKLDNGHRKVVTRMFDDVNHGFDKGCAKGSVAERVRDEAYSLAIASIKEALV